MDIERIEGDGPTSFDGSVRDVGTKKRRRERDDIQTAIDKYASPEYIQFRTGENGERQHYIPEDVLVRLANAIFGYDGWSSQLMDVKSNDIDPHVEDMENDWTREVTVVTRVTLTRSGTFHEGVGFGRCAAVNRVGKTLAWMRALEEARKDSFETAMGLFGNVFGGCLDDEEYMEDVEGDRGWKEYAIYELPSKRRRRDERTSVGREGSSGCVAGAGHEEKVVDATTPRERIS
jgi:DNA recombination protein Rad52